MYLEKNNLKFHIDTYLCPFESKNTFHTTAKSIPLNKINPKDPRKREKEKFIFQRDEEEILEEQRIINFRPMDESRFITLTDKLTRKDGFGHVSIYHSICKDNKIKS